MKKIGLVFLTLCLLLGRVQGQDRPPRPKDSIREMLVNWTQEDKALLRPFSSKIGLNGIPLSQLLLALAQNYSLNVSIDPELENITVYNSFTKVSLVDVLSFLSANHSLDITLDGNIVQFKKYAPPPPRTEDLIRVDYHTQRKVLTLDFKNQPLSDVFRRIMQITGENLLFSKSIEQNELSLFIQQVPLKKAFEQLALQNGLEMIQSREGFFLFYALDSGSDSEAYKGKRKGLHIEVIDSIQHIISGHLKPIDFQLFIF